MSCENYFKDVLETSRIKEGISKDALESLLKINKDSNLTYEQLISEKPILPPISTIKLLAGALNRKYETFLHFAFLDGLHMDLPVTIKNMKLSILLTAKWENLSEAKIDLIERIIELQFKKGANKKEGILIESKKST